MDESKERRKELIDISEDLFGKQNVAPICTYNTLSTKVAIRDIGKVLDEDPESPYYQQIPYKIRDEVAKMIPTVKTLDDLGEEVEKEETLQNVLSTNPKMEKIYSQYPKWFYAVLQLEGLPKSMGRHAAGTIIAPNPIVEYAPLCRDKEGNSMLQIEMHAAMDDLKLIKMDYLGLKTLDIVDEALKIAGITWDDVDINHLNLDDKDVFDNIYKTGNTVAVFQMESLEARKMCIEAKANDIEDVIAINAANRPGTKDGFPDYCANKLNPENAHLIHEDLRPIFKTTNLILLYQEQVLQIFRYAGFPETEVDNARRAIGKKKKDVMAKLEVEFREKLSAKGWTKEQLDQLWELILKQTGYSFNRGHSVAYGLLSYLTAYLKYHYPVAFMTACLNADREDVSRIGILINECYNLGINVLPPKINESRKDFTAIPERNEILFGLEAIKGLGSSIVEKIIANKPYSSLKDFIARSGCGKSHIVQLIKSGAFGTDEKRKKLLIYFNSILTKKEYKPVKTLPSPKTKLLDYGIDSTKFKKSDGKEDKEAILELYNSKRKKEFEKELEEKQNKERQVLIDKYLDDEYMWEFATLSMFLTNNPLKEVSHYVTDWNEIEKGTEGTLLAVVINLTRKKDKNNNIFAYIDLYTPNGIIEAVAWSSIYKAHMDLLDKGSCISLLGRKGENNQMFIKDVKTFKEWLKEIKTKKEKDKEKEEGNS